MSNKPMPNKPRLGRGLSSLLGGLPVEAEVGTGEVDARTDQEAGPAVPGVQLVEIELGKIRPNPHQPRRTMDPASLTELAASMKGNGVIQPVLVRPEGEGYELIAGERRWRAAELAGLASIPAIVRNVDGFTQAQMALVENIQREDLNPMDRAGAYQSLLGQLGLTHAELAGRLGEDRAAVSHYIRLLELAGEVQEAIRAGQLSMGHAKLLVGVEDKARQVELCQLVLAQGLSVRNLERILSVQPAPAAPKAAPPNAHLADLGKSITQHLGLRTYVKSGKRKGTGKVIIHYATLDEFDGLMNRMGLKLEE